MEKSEATYQYCEEVHGNGMFFITDCCGNRMYSVDNNPMKYHGCLCPKCFHENNKLVTLYLRGTSDGIRVFNEHVSRTESKEKEMTVTGCYEKDANFIPIYSGDVMYTIARGTGEWGSVRVGGTFANGQPFTKADYERMKEDCDNVGTFVLD